MSWERSHRIPRCRGRRHGGRRSRWRRTWRTRMTSTSPHYRRLVLGAAALLAGSLALPLGAVSAAGAEPDLPGSTLYVNPFSTTLEAAQPLTGQARDDAQ